MDFYSSLAADAGESDVSEADPKEMAKSIAGLDDMDDDILGMLGSTKTSKTAKPAAKPAAKLAASVETPVAKSKLSMDDILRKPDPLDDLFNTRPKTTGSEEKQKPVTDTKPRPATTEQPKKQKTIDFGQFQDDDPLAGLDLSDDETAAIKKPAVVSKEKTTLDLYPVESELSQPSNHETVDEVKASALSLLNERPVTRSGSRTSRMTEEPQLPVKSRSNPRKSAATNDENSWDESPASVESPKPSAKHDNDEKPAASKRKDEVEFSDDSDLDLGLDDGKKRSAEAEKAGRSIMDSLLGKDSIAKHLERPGTGSSTADGKKLFSLDKKSTAASNETNRKPAEDGDNDNTFSGAYTPSAVSSRPGTGRSVRFEDQSQRPATAEPKSNLSLDDDWLGIGSSSQKRRPLGLASTIDMQASSDDWLDMAASASRPKTSPAAVLTDKKPPRTPENRKPASSKKSDDDWLNALNAKVDADDPIPKPRKPFSRQSSLDSTGSAAKATLARQSSADTDWLGLSADRREESAGESSPKRSLSRDGSVTTSPRHSRRNSLTPAGGDNSSSKSDDWLSGSKDRKQLTRQASSTDWLFDDSNKPTPSMSKSKERADEKALDIFSEPKASSKMPWDKDDSKPSSREAVKSKKSKAEISALLSDDVPALTSSVLGEQPMEDMLTQQRFRWEHEQKSLMEQQQSQLEAMQKAQQEVIQARQRQQEQLIEQQRRMQEDAMKLQKQQLQAMATFQPSPFFPSGLAPAQQSEIQLQNVELEGKVKRLEHEKSYLESLIESLKSRHAEELQSADNFSKNRIQLVEESYQRRESRLREEIEMLASQNLAKLKMAEEEKSVTLISHHRALDDLDREKHREIERLREQHKQDIDRLKQDHDDAIKRLRTAKDQEIEASLAYQSNPGSIQFLMDQMKQHAAGLTSMQVNIASHHKQGLDERDLALSTRETQLKVLQDCLLKQQEENDKERTRLQELIARMELQLREQERQLHQEKWTVSQEKSKLAALQAAVDQEKTILTDHVTRERSELNRAKDGFLAEQRQAMTQLTEERRALAEERTQLAVAQRQISEKESRESLKTSQGSAQYEGMIQALEQEREKLASRSKVMDDEEKRLVVEKSTLTLEQKNLEAEQLRVNDLAQQLQKEMEKVEVFSADCVSREKVGRDALLEAKRIEGMHSSRLLEVQKRLAELKSLEKKVAEERLLLARESKQMEALRGMNLCVACKQPINRSPYPNLYVGGGSLPPNVGVVSPQQSLNLADPSIIQYKLQADRDKDFLKEETAYLDALKYSPYHKK